MTLALAWLVFPLLFGALCLGCGLVLRAICGGRLPGTLLVPVGFATVITVASLTTSSATTARATVPLLVCVSAAGFVSSRRYRPRIEGWALAAAVAVFAVYAAPIVLSGSVTFGGYISLDDTATWLALADNALSHGRSVAGLPPSTYSAVLHDYLSSGYPLGSFLPLGIGNELTGQDAAWLFQPEIAFALAAVLAVSIYAVSGTLLQRRGLRAGVAFIAAQPAVLFGYAFWSGIKEVTVAALAVTLTALVTARAVRAWRVRDLLPLAVTAAAVVDSLAVTGAIWLGALVALAVALVVEHRRHWRVILLAALGGSALVAIPALSLANSFLSVADAGGSGSITSTSSLGNLIAPLSSFQLFGIWPANDFRIHPADMTLTYILIGAVVIAGVYGLWVAIGRRAAGVPLLAAAALGGYGLVMLAHALGHSSPWLDGKAIAMASPGVLAAGIAGAALMFERHRQVEGAVLATAIAAGVLWSNGLAYSAVWLAPSAQFRELQTIGQRFAGDGPALITEYQPYAARHFLRALAPESPAERRYRPDYLRSGGYLPTSGYADLDAFVLSSVLAYRTIVVRTSPVESRPPSIYHLVWKSTWYEVWQRAVTPTQQILEHDSLGGPNQPVGVASCSRITSLAALASSVHGHLVAAERSAATVVSLTSGQYPSSWQPGANGTITPHSAGTISVFADVARSGTYGLWVGGSFRDTLTIDVDGLPDGSVTDQINENDQLTPFHSIYLAAGSHQISLTYSGSGLRPGDDGTPFAFGPLEIGTSDSSDRLVDVAPSQARSLCGRPYDWIEAVASAS